MAQFLLESYARDVASARSDVQRMKECATRQRHAGTRIRVLRSIFLPEDETSLVLFEAASAKDVRETVNGAGLSLDRIAAVAQVPTGGEAW
jgi:hypothetical protein